MGRCRDWTSRPRERRKANPASIFTITLAVFVVLELIVPTLRSLVLDEASPVVQLALGKTLICLCILGVVWSRGAFGAVGFRAPLAPVSLLYGLPLILLGLMVLTEAETISTEPGFLIGWFWYSLAGVISEEVVFRGALWESLIHRGPWRTAWATSALFGMIHLMGLQSDIPATVILAQVCFAMGVGMALAAVRMRAGSLWTALILHQGFNCAAFWSAGGLTPVFDPGTEVRFLIPGLVIGLWGAVAFGVALRKTGAGD